MFVVAAISNKRAPRYKRHKGASASDAKRFNPIGLKTLKMLSHGLNEKKITYILYTVAGFVALLLWGLVDVVSLMPLPLVLPLLLLHFVALLCAVKCCTIVTL